MAVNYRDLLAYPATGGFSHQAILPAPILRGLLGLEQMLPQLLMRLAALRMLIIVERGTDRRLD